MWLNESLVRGCSAGEIAPAGTSVRIDNRSSHLITLEQEGSFPPSFDGQVALYREAPLLCHRGERARSPLGACC
jgi:hypothetical protein